MTSTDDRKVQWRVQVRKSRAHKWVNKGLFETRERARWQASQMRSLHSGPTSVWVDEQLVFRAEAGYGFGNTRVLRYVRGQA